MHDGENRFYILLPKGDTSDRKRCTPSNNVGISHSVRSTFAEKNDYRGTPQFISKYKHIFKLYGNISSYGRNV